MIDPENASPPKSSLDRHSTPNKNSEQQNDGDAPQELQNEDVMSQVAEVADPRLQLKDIYISPTIKIPEDIQVTKAKAFLQTTGAYKELAASIMQLLTQRQASIKKHTPLQKYTMPIQSVFQDVEVVPTLDVYKVTEVEGKLPDIMALNTLWEWGGASFGNAFTLFLSLRELMSTEDVSSVRMWGKIYGSEKDYYIVEADGENLVEEEILSEEEEEEIIDEDEDEIAKPVTNPIPFVPIEVGGANKYVYYVSHSVNGPWTKLPPVNPEKLVIAKSIQTYFTGKLDREIKSYPPFNGNEGEYLRCQIARISAATVICPVNYYIIDDDENEIKLNEEYENADNDAFLNPEQWVHHTPYLLPQGRTEWINPFPKDEDKDEEEDAVEAEPETGPEPLTSIGEDDDFGKLPAWRSAFCAKFLTSKYSPVMMQSTRWPGARSIVFNNQFTNIYVGYGLKEMDENSSIYQALPDMMNEYGGEEVEPVVECIDPAVEEEHVYEEEVQESLELAEDDE